MAIKSGGNYQQVREATATVGAIAANTTGTVSLTVPGVDTNDIAVVSCAGLTTGLAISDAYVSAAGTIIVKLANVTAAEVAAASETFKVVVL